MATKSLSDIALKALTDPRWPKRNNLCQMWVRLCIQEVYGSKYDGVIWKPTAKAAGEAALKAGLGFRYNNQPPRPNDILYKLTGSGGAGHVGIYLGNGQVAENSTYHWNRTGGKDARGIRTLAQYGGWNVTVRLPDSKAQQPKPAPPQSTPAKPATPEIIIPQHSGPAFQVVVNAQHNIGAGLWHQVSESEADLYVPARALLRSIGLDIVQHNDQRGRASQPRFYIVTDRAK